MRRVDRFGLHVTRGLSYWIYGVILNLWSHILDLWSHIGPMESYIGPVESFCIFTSLSHVS